MTVDYWLRIKKFLSANNQIPHSNSHSQSNSFFYLRPMSKYISIIIFSLYLSVQVTGSYAQSFSGLLSNTNANIDSELSSLMKDLDLTNDQGIVLGMLILKYSLEFDYKEFENASDVKKYSMVKSKFKDIDKDLKDVLDKRQYKVYKKKKKEIRKKMVKG